MKSAFLIFIFTLCLSIGGCSKKVSFRVFNHSDRVIIIGNKSIPPNDNALSSFAGISKGHELGFGINDSGKELFYVILIRNEEGPIFTQVATVPKASQHSGLFGPIEYFVEYTSSGEIYFMDGKDEKSASRLNPQPLGFPLKPKE